MSRSRKERLKTATARLGRARISFISMGGGEWEEGGDFLYIAGDETRYPAFISALLSRLYREIFFDRNVLFDRSPTSAVDRSLRVDSRTSSPTANAFDNYTFVASQAAHKRGGGRERREEETSAALSIYHPLARAAANIIETT